VSDCVSCGGGSISDGFPLVDDLKLGAPAATTTGGNTNVTPPDQ
jgi:hypothetical protein